VRFPIRQIAIDSADEGKTTRLEKSVRANSLVTQRWQSLCLSIRITPVLIEAIKAELVNFPAGKVLMIGAGGVGPELLFCPVEVGGNRKILVTDFGVSAVAQSLG